MTAATDATRRASLAANLDAKRAKLAASREARVAAALAAYTCADDVPAHVWEAAVAWASTSGACFADIASDVAAVVPTGYHAWNPDDIDAALLAAVERMTDDARDASRHGRY